MALKALLNFFFVLGLASRPWYGKNGKIQMFHLRLHLQIRVDGFWPLGVGVLPR
jgi:hypothetical protein